MKRLTILAAVAITLLLSAQIVSANCGSADCSDSKAVKQATCGEKAEAKLSEVCLKCGQIKGSDICCKPDQEKCAKCGLVKGSPGCCKIKEGTKKAFVNQKTGKIICCAKGDESKKKASGACPLGKK